MRISIWQQFSSNHSATFMTVGRFESHQLAELVADELRAILTEISEFQ